RCSTASTHPARHARERSRSSVHGRPRGVNGMSSSASPESQKPAGGLARKAPSLAFLLRYRKAEVFSFDLDEAALELVVPKESGDGRPERFVDELEALGPTFVKIGQWLSTRPDMVPAEYLVALERMQDSVAPLPWATVHGMIAQE